MRKTVILPLAAAAVLVLTSCGQEPSPGQPPAEEPSPSQPHTSGPRNAPMRPVGLRQKTLLVGRSKYDADK
jgi:predicted small lipoprotein YifL